MVDSAIKGRAGRHRQGADEHRERTLASLLRRLAMRGARLEPAGAGNGPATYLLTNPAGRAIPVTSSTVEQAFARGLLARCEDGTSLGITRAGAQWLKRHIAAGDAYRAQHQQHATRPSPESAQPRAPGAQPVLVNDAESPLAWLRRRKDKDGRPLLDETEFMAGERLRADFTFAQLMPRVTVDWDAVGGQGRRGGGAGGSGHMRDAVAAARARVRRALSAVGPELANILLDVCCLLKGLEEVERDEQLSARSGKQILRYALSALARHYGLIGGGEASERIRRKLAHWGVGDFRPGLEDWR